LSERAKATLDCLLDAIEAGTRHADVAMLHKGEVETRVCPKWAIKRIAITEAIEPRQRRLEKDLPNEIDPSIRKLNFAMLS